MPRRNGFTLAELMVVILIIGIAAAAVALSLPEPGGGLRVEGERLAARARAAQEEAIITGRSRSLVVDNSGYSILRSGGGTWQEQVRFAWEQGSVPMTATGQAQRSTFDPTGSADPLQLVLARGSQRVEVRIGSDGGVRVVR